MEDFLTMCIGTLVLGSLALWYWSYGTLLKKAFGESKLGALWLLVPLVGFVIPIEWGRRARRLLSDVVEKQPPQWFWPLTLLLYLLWTVPLALFAPRGLLAWAILVLIWSPLIWGSTQLLVLACSAPKAYGWLLPLPGMWIALPIYYGLQAHNQLKAAVTSFPDVGESSQADEKRWYKRGAFWVSVGAGLVWFLALTAGVTLPDEETAGGRSFGSSRPPTVEGIVVDKLTSAPISGASVTCLHEGASVRQTTTDGRGYFLISDVPKEASLRIEAPDYESAEFPVPQGLGNLSDKYELVKTPKATAETIAKLVLHRAYADIYPYLNSHVRQQYSRDAYFRLLTEFDTQRQTAMKQGHVWEDIQVVGIDNVSPGEVRVFITLASRNLRTGHLTKYPGTFVLTRDRDGTWRSNWPVPSIRR